MVKKCKDENHVDAVEGFSAIGDPPGVWTVEFMPDAGCRNLPGQSPGVFVLCRHGKPKMQMLRSLALVLPGQLRQAVPGLATSAVRIRHMRVKLRVTFAVLDDQAALTLASLIDACVAAHP